MAAEEMQLIVLGSGTSVPHPRRAAAGFWLETAQGSLLLDAGAAVVHRLAQESLDWAGLDAIWISHFHLDHVGGLAPLLFATKYAPQTQARRKPLRIYGPRGTAALLGAFDRADDYKLLRQPFPTEVREVAPDETFEILPALAAHTFKTPHTPESLAIRLEADGRQPLVYTSDTGYADELADFARDAGLLVIECSFPRDKPVATHLDLNEAMRVARASRASRVVLTHLYPDWDDLDVATEARKQWPDGETIGAFDGLRLALGAGGQTG